MTDAPSDGAVRYEVRDRVAIITLDRPERMNAFTLPMVDAWADRLTDAQADPRST